MGSMSKIPSEPPFIEIELISTTETALMPKDILEIIKKRFEKTHNVKTSWAGTETTPIVRLNYVSLDALVKGYSRDLFLFNYFIELMNADPEWLQELLNLVNFSAVGQTSLNSGESLDACTEPNNYVVLKYRTNYKDPLRKNYQFTSKIAQILGENVCIEEIDDGFLYFFQTKGSFEDANFDKLQPAELRMWFQKKGLNPEHPKIRPIFDLVH